MIKSRLIVVVMAGISLFALAAPAPADIRPAAVATQRSTSKLKGTLKSLDATSAVVVPADNKNAEITFQVTAATQKTGAVAVGDVVEVAYYFEQGRRVATALTGKASGR